jgi:cytidyltransferase-like protein
MPKKKVFVTGCFDMLHSGHVRFLEEAALGGVLVGIGSDQTVKELKGRYRVCALAAAADGCWRAILSRSEQELGRQVRASFKAQTRIFPGMMDSNVRAAIKQYAGKALGWKLSGAIQLKIRRPDA